MQGLVVLFFVILFFFIRLVLSLLPFLQFFRCTGAYTTLGFPTAFSLPHISAWAAPATLLVSHHNFENCRDIDFKTCTWSHQLFKVLWDDIIYLYHVFKTNSLPQDTFNFWENMFASLLNNHNKRLIQISYKITMNIKFIAGELSNDAFVTNNSPLFS